MEALFRLILEMPVPEGAEDEKPKHLTVFETADPDEVAVMAEMWGLNLAINARETVVTAIFLPTNEQVRMRALGRPLEDAQLEKLCIRLFERLWDMLEEWSHTAFDPGLRTRADLQPSLDLGTVRQQVWTPHEQAEDEAGTQALPACDCEQSESLSIEPFDDLRPALRNWFGEIAPAEA